MAQGGLSVVDSPNARFRTRLRAREPLLGCFVKTPHPAVVEVLASSGALDCICLDAEHAPFDRAALDVAILAARAGGLPALVRVPSPEPHHILNALDLGAAGVVVPHVLTGDQAAELGRAARYLTDGRSGGRGYAGATRASAFAAPPIADGLARAAAETSLIVQVEDAAALPNVEVIAGAEGVDAVFVGRIDLTVALGATNPKAPTVLAAVEDVTRRALGAGAAVGMFTGDLSELSHWRERGASLFLLGSDQGFLRAGAQGLRAAAGF